MIWWVRSFTRVLPAEDDFWRRVSIDLYRRYDLSDAVVVINGDRASWIRKGAEYFDDAMYQMDRWHLKKDLRNLLRDTSQKSEALAAFHASEPERLLRAIDKGKRELPRASRRRKDLRRLHRDIASNPQSARDYRLRLYERGISTDDCRGLGAAESQVDRLKDRTAKRGRSWSFSGLRGMLSSLTEYLTGSIGQYLKRISITNSLTTQGDLEKQAERVTGEIIRGNLEVKQARPPAMDVGTNRSGGLSQFFHKLIRTQPTTS